MSKLGMNALIAAVALAFSGSVFAADDAGEHPLPTDGANAESTLTRAQVEAEEAANPPAPGQGRAREILPAVDASETRAEVETEVKELEAAEGEFPDASGESSASPQPAE